MEEVHILIYLENLRGWLGVLMLEQIEVAAMSILNF